MMASAYQLEKVAHEKFCNAHSTEQLFQRKNNSPRPKVFYSYGCSLLTITHYICGKAKQLPFPLGKLAASTENTVGSWIQPVIGSIESLGLNLLRMADYQLSVIGSVAEYISPHASVLFEKTQKLEDFSVKLPDMVIMTVDKLSDRGVTGSIADLWVKYEADMNGQTDKLLRMAETVPLLSSIASIVNAVVCPLSGMVSNWMLKHSEIEVKEVSLDNTVDKGAADYPIDAYIHSATDSHQSLERTESFTENHDAEVSKDEQHSDKILQDDNDKISQHSDKILQEDNDKISQHSDKILQDDNDKISQAAEEGKRIPVPVNVVETSPDPILELFDASWHMGSSIIPPRTGLSPKQKAGK